MPLYSQQLPPENCIYKMQAKRFKVFESQDVEAGHFDVTFELSGKKLYAHKIFLTSVSEPLDAWLSTRWTKKDEVIKISDYSFNDFYEFLHFLYTGDCKITEDNVFALTDMAEFYGIEYLKGFCDIFLSVTKSLLEAANVEEMHDFADRYSLLRFRQSVKDFIYLHTEEVYEAEKFIAYKKSFIDYLTTFYGFWFQEKFFENVYNWAENRVKKEKADDATNFNLLEAIKAELSTILPRIKLSDMKMEFLMNFVVEKGFLLSPAEMYRIFKIREEPFKTVVELAERQALKKQEMSSDTASFDLVDSVKADLACVVPHVKFYEMDKSFLTNFVAAKGIISEYQANHVYDTRVYVENNGKTVTGLFKDDDLGIRLYIENLRICKIKRQSTVKVRFVTFKFPIPSTPSTVTKIKGVEWYLCLEKDQTLTFKHCSAVKNTDYLLTEMTSQKEFELTPGETTLLTVRYNNI